jgi:hypothetical protein
MKYPSPLSESFLAILQAATKLAEQSVVPNFVNLTLPEETLKVAISLANQANNTLAVFQMVQKKNAALQRFLIKLGWPPPWHLPAVLLDRIVEAFESGNFSVEEVTQLFIDLYGQERMKELLEKWKQSEHIGRRAPILNEGIQDHLDGRFFSSVCIFSTQIEGVIGEAIGRQPNPKNDADIIFRDTTLSRVARAFYIKVANESFSWSRSSPIPELSRNAILHGRDTEFGTPSNSLRVILLFDAICSAIGEMKLGRLTGHPKPRSRRKRKRNR